MTNWDIFGLVATLVFFGYVLWPVPFGIIDLIRQERYYARRMAVNARKDKRNELNRS
jgi:hypothetical protein